MTAADPAADLPVLGAAMPVRCLETYRDWLVAGQRDLELQDFIRAETLNGDGWRAAAARARELLSGHTGRLGIHGPFFGFTIATDAWLWLAGGSAIATAGSTKPNAHWFGAWWQQYMA